MFDEFKSVAILLGVAALGIAGYFSFNYITQLNQEVADTFVANALLQEQRDLSDAENQFLSYTLSEYEKNNQKSKEQLKSVEQQHSELTGTIEGYDIEDNIEIWFERDKIKLDDCLGATINRVLEIYQKTTGGIDGGKTYEDHLPCTRPAGAGVGAIIVPEVVPQ